MGFWKKITLKALLALPGKVVAIAAKAEAVLNALDAILGQHKPKGDKP